MAVASLSNLYKDTSIINNGSDLNLSSRRLKIITFNMHGFNQGNPTINGLINDYSPDIIMLQEHWQTPANMYKFDKFVDYFSFGCSAMSTLLKLVYYAVDLLLGY